MVCRASRAAAALALLLLQEVRAVVRLRQQQRYVGSSSLVRTPGDPGTSDEHPTNFLDSYLSTLKAGGMSTSGLAASDGAVYPAEAATGSVPSQAVSGSASDNVQSQELAAQPTQTNTTAEVDAVRHQVVVAKYDEDISWLHQLPKNFDVSVYQSNDSSAPHFIENVGNEASKYLSYIVEHYDSLPDTVAFIQAGQMDWHDPISKEATMQRWDWGKASAHGGIAFLPTSAPCLIEDSEASTSEGVGTDAAAADEEKQRRKSLVPSEEMCVDVVEHSPPQMETVRSVWAEVFEPELGALPKHWYTHCCAQFQVTRDAIRQHPPEFYQHILTWTMEHDRSLLQSDYAQEMKRNHDEARRDAGHVFEVLWALIFSTPMSRVVIS